MGHLLRDNDPSLHLDLLSEVFEGKSANTLAKRVNSLLHYLNHWRLVDETTTDFLPFSSSLVYGYLRHLKSNNRLSAAKDFLQCTRFCEHVIGLKSVDSLTRPWISGIAKAAYAHSKPKKESRPLTVKEIIQLETFLIKGMGHHLDKYACGVFLCATLIVSSSIFVRVETEQGTLKYIQWTTSVRGCQESQAGRT